MNTLKKMLGIVLLLISFLLFEACEEGDAISKEEYKIGLTQQAYLADFTTPLTGEVIGTEDYVYKKLWSNDGQDLVCRDDAAVFNLTIYRDRKASFPEYSKLSWGDIPKNDFYFRLDVHGLERIADKNVCLIRDASDDRVLNVIEGAFNPITAKFAVLSCGGDFEPVKAHLVYYANSKTVDGDLICSQGMRVFSFSKLQLK